MSQGLANGCLKGCTRVCTDADGDGSDGLHFLLVTGAGVTWQVIDYMLRPMSRSNSAFDMAAEFSPESELHLRAPPPSCTSRGRRFSNESV